MSQNGDIQKQLKNKRKRELLAYFGELVKREGLASAVGRGFSYIRRRHGGKKGRFLPTKAQLERQRQTDTTGWPSILICVPVYNVPEMFFAQLVDSVLAQSYPNWQLCIADASDPSDTTVQTVLASRKDSRVLCERVENRGISANTNHAAKMATGDYIALLDHDDLLSPNAMFEVARRIVQTGAGFVYSDEALFTTDYKKPSVGHFKPDYSPQYLLNVNYIAHLAAVQREIFDQVGGFRSECDGSQDLDLFLRVAEVTGGAEHIAKVLYYWRQHAGSTSTGVQAKPYVTKAAMRAIDDHLARTGVQGHAVEGKFPSTYKVDYAILGQPLVSIIIPNYEHVEDLSRCIDSIVACTDWPRFEVVVVENNSKKPETFEYYRQLTKVHPNCRVVEYKEIGFNFSKLCNFGAEHAQGEYLLFLNNDTEVIGSGWMGEMLQLCQLDKTGVVGAMLYYPDDSIQHAGVIVGLGGYAGHSHKYARRGAGGYMFRLACVQELSAVTGACMMVKRSVFDLVEGFDPGFSVAYNDVDFCLRVAQRGYSVLFTPYAELYHYESKSRGSDEKGEAAERFKAEQRLMQQRYGDALLRDPYYSPWLTLDREDFSETDIPPKGED